MPVESRGMRVETGRSARSMAVAVSGSVDASDVVTVCLKYDTEMAAARLDLPQTSMPTDPTWRVPWRATILEALPKSSGRWQRN